MLQTLSMCLKPQQYLSFNNPIYEAYIIVSSEQPKAYVILCWSSLLYLIRLE